jgi:predicted dehydrogenase
MMSDRLRTVLVGLGRIAAGYADDPTMARCVPFATHAQVLATHPAFLWDAAVDPSECARRRVRARWGLAHVAARPSDLPSDYRADVAVIATPAHARLEILEHLAGVRAVLVEKPLSTTVTEAREFLATCRERNVLVQVNLLRRADDTLRKFAGGGLHERIGRPQAAFGLYGNGLLNNGTHMVDLARMMLGEVESVQAARGAESDGAGPIPGDVLLPFTMRVQSGPLVMMHPLRFKFYRENALDIWGERGRVAMMQESLTIARYPCVANRAMQGEFEIASDRPDVLPCTIGNALYRMYDNLASALLDGVPLWSPGDSALQTASVVDAVLESERRGGTVVPVRG